MSDPSSPSMTLGNFHLEGVWTIAAFENISFFNKKPKFSSVSEVFRAMTSKHLAKKQINEPAKRLALCNCRASSAVMRIGPQRKNDNAEYFPKVVVLTWRDCSSSGRKHCVPVGYRPTCSYWRCPVCSYVARNAGYDVTQSKIPKRNRPVCSGWKSVRDLWFIFLREGWKSVYLKCFTS